MGQQAHFWGKKFDYTNVSSFKRAPQAESNATEIIAIRLHRAELQATEN